jgi:hypothetical protein
MLYIHALLIIFLDYIEDVSMEITPPPELPPPFKIEFDVPTGKYSRDLEIDSNWYWYKFVDEVARLMDCHSSTVSLGYILPWKIKGNAKPSPKILDGDAAFEKLKADIQIWLSEQQAKNKGKGVVKHFTVQLVNLAADNDASKVRLFSYIALCC